MTQTQIEHCEQWEAQAVEAPGDSCAPQRPAGRRVFNLRIYHTLRGVESNANPKWLEEMLTCACVAALENERLDVGDVWQVFRRRASGLTTSNKMAMGCVMRAARRAGWIEAIPRPDGRVCNTNNNSRGTAFYRSRIYQDGQRFEFFRPYVPDSDPQGQLPDI